MASSRVAKCSQCSSTQVRPLVERAPTAFGHLLCALDLWFSPPRELAIVGDPRSAVARAVLEPYNPNAVVAFGPADDVPLLVGKHPVDGKPAVYVCERFACRAPVTDPAMLKEQLDALDANAL